MITKTLVIIVLAWTICASGQTIKRVNLADLRPAEREHVINRLIESTRVTETNVIVHYDARTEAVSYELKTSRRKAERDDIMAMLEDGQTLSYYIDGPAKCHTCQGRKMVPRGRGLIGGKPCPACDGQGQTNATYRHLVRERH